LCTEAKGRVPILRAASRQPLNLKGWWDYHLSMGRIQQRLALYKNCRNQLGTQNFTTSNWHVWWCITESTHTHTYIHTYIYIHTYTVIYLVNLLEELILTALQVEIFIGLFYIALWVCQINHL
jgi:hypothetical protein